MTQSLQGVSSALIARNESWVRRQANTLMRRLPSNVEKADLIQVGLIAVAEAAQSFRADEAADEAQEREAFLRYARQRVKGAMLDELRKMDHLARSDRRRLKVVQLARERWLALHHRPPGLQQLSGLCGIPIDEITRLEQADRAARLESVAAGDDSGELMRPPEAATPRDEVEARVDTAIVLRHLGRIFAELPERERRAIDAYMGIGLTPAELASELELSPSRVTQLYHHAFRRIAARLGVADERALDRQPSHERLDALVERREYEQARAGDGGHWGELLERTLAQRAAATAVEEDAQGRLVVGTNTRWG